MYMAEPVTIIESVYFFHIHSMENEAPLSPAETLTASEALALVPDIADLDDMFVREMQEQADADTRLKASRRATFDITNEITRRRELLRVTSPERAAADPRSMEDLLADPSYKDDDSFKPSEKDLARLEASNVRTTTAESAGSMKYRIESLNRQIAFFKNPRASLTDPSLIRAKIAEIDQRWFSEFRFGAERARLVLGTARIEEQIAGAPAKLPGTITERDALTAELQRMEGLLALMPAAAPYDISLNTGDTAKSAVMSPRSNHAVRVSFGNDCFILDLPAGPDDTTFSSRVEFDFPSNADAQSFASLLGEQIPVAAECYEGLGEVVGSRFDRFDETFVPFPLELVQVGGVQKYRIPQVVIQRFGQFIS